MSLTPEQVRIRQQHCFENNLCFVSLKPVIEDGVSFVVAPTHRDSLLSLPILVRKEYIK